MVEFYISQTEAANRAVREAACACIAELGTKVHKSPVFTVHTVVVLNRDMHCVVWGLFTVHTVVVLNGDMHVLRCMGAVYSECRVLFMVYTHEECADASWVMMCTIPFNDC